MSFALHAPRIFDGTGWHLDKAVVILDGKITGFCPVADVPAGIKLERLGAGFLAPGFVDLQVNGGGGVLFNNDLSVEGLATICAAHAKFGTTALLPTLITDTPDVTDQAIAAGIAAAKAEVPGFAGLHLEGPHLSQARKGAHNPALIRPMTDADLQKLIAARECLPALMVTIAVESVTAEQVGRLTAAGIKVSIGHSEATYSEALERANAGATLVTHLFNAMSQLTGRQPGLVGAALDIGSLHVGLIADTFHVDPVTMAAALRAKSGPGRIFLVTDAMSTIGTDLTEFMLNGRVIKREGGRLTLEDGTLAGADLDMAHAVSVMAEIVGLDEALRMASQYPAEAMGLAGLGALADGNFADIVWLSDDLAAKAVWQRGARQH